MFLAPRCRTFLNSFRKIKFLTKANTIRYDNFIYVLLCTLCVNFRLVWFVGHTLQGNSSRFWMASQRYLYITLGIGGVYLTILLPYEMRCIVRLLPTCIILEFRVLQIYIDEVLWINLNLYITTVYGELIGHIPIFLFLGVEC